MHRSAFFAAAAMGFLAASNSQAATLDFTEAGATGLLPAVVSLSNATLTSFGSNNFIGGGGPDPIIYCGAAADTSCATDYRIDFAFDIENLTFSSFGALPGDSVEVTALLNGLSLGSQTVTTNTLVDFSALGAIDALFFADNSTERGIGWGDFSFDVAVIPLPAGLPLLLTGLGALVLVRRRGREPIPG